MVYVLDASADESPGQARHKHLVRVYCDQSDRRRSRSVATSGSGGSGRKQGREVRHFPW